MNCLIDTHVLLWWYEEPTKLKETTIEIISNGDNSIYVSDVVIWEMVIKVSLGKLKPNQNKTSILRLKEILIYSQLNDSIFIA
jgi:PIN domain nuclease of toxin-antitoxin system